MNKILIMQLITLSLYALLMGYCFCDGFKLNISRKLIWFILFLGISVLIFGITGRYELSLILPLPCLLAILFCHCEKQKSKQ
jgi:hypothetical protein